MYMSAPLLSPSRRILGQAHHYHCNVDDETLHLTPESYHAAELLQRFSISVLTCLEAACLPKIHIGQQSVIKTYAPARNSHEQLLNFVLRLDEGIILISCGIKVWSSCLVKKKSVQ